MTEFEQLEDFFNHMLNKTIIGVGVIDDELVITLNDKSIVTFFSDDDISMNISKAN
jgi:hypothetical protein